MKFSVGDKVMALWPGSGLYYPAEIKRIVGDRADILYSDGTEMEVFLKQIKVCYIFTGTIPYVCLYFHCRVTTKVIIDVMIRDTH